MCVRVPGARGASFAPGLSPKLTTCMLRPMVAQWSRMVSQYVDCVLCVCVCKGEEAGV